VGTTENQRKYNAIAGQTFAMSDNGVMKYLLTDHLGSTVAVTDAAGALLGETRYAEQSGALRPFHKSIRGRSMPFGEHCADVGMLTGTDRTYTGQRDVPATGLMDYKARMYSPYLNRWTQPDTIIPDQLNPQDWDRYGYVRNNPIKYNDPSGHDVGCAGSDADNCLGLNKPKDRSGYSPMTPHTKSRVAESILGRNKTTWDEAAPEYREALSADGWDQYSWDHSDYIGPGVRNAYWYEDPAVWLAISVVTVKLAPGAVLAVGQYFCLDGDCGNEISAIDAVFPKNTSQLLHIFRNAIGHLPIDTPLNRDLLLRTVSPDNFQKIDKWGNMVFARLLADGTEIWVEVQNGIIQHGGINQMPRYFH
jgi:RHS repeat-associated protein